MNSNPVVWFEIYCSDIQRAKSFYEAVLGLELQHLPSPAEDGFVMYAFPGDPQGGGATGALASMPGELPEIAPEKQHVVHKRGGNGGLARESSAREGDDSRHPGARALPAPAATLHLPGPLECERHEFPPTAQ